MTTIEIIGAGRQWVDAANNGKTVYYSIPAGCVLRKSTDFNQWQDVARSSPFMHEGPTASYAIDCVTYAGSPVTATLEIA